MIVHLGESSDLDRLNYVLVPVDFDEGLGVSSFITAERLERGSTSALGSGCWGCMGFVWIFRCFRSSEAL